jgi:carbamoyltransferase
MDLAASIQQITEEITIKIARHAKKITGAKYAVFAGGVALNCVANGKIAMEKIFDKIWIQPAAGDAGAALGAALLGSHRLLKQPRICQGYDSQKGSLLGPRYSMDEIAAFLSKHNLPHHRMNEAAERNRRIAEALAAGKVVGYFAGRMEYGPRSLGARSILGDPRRADTQSKMNLKIKFRESFRPFAPSVLTERAGDYFEYGLESPYMLLIDYLKKDRRCASGLEDFYKGSDDMLELLNRSRSDVPAVTHIDYSARIQTVDRRTNPDFYGVIAEFENLTACPMVVNTSFNVRGEPIVCTPEDAYRCFMRTGIDLLVLEDFLLWKHEQPVPEGAELD